MPSRTIGPTAIEVRVGPIVKSFATVMQVQEGRLERWVVYVNVSAGGDPEDVIPIVGADRSGIGVLAARIIIGVDSHDGTIGQTGGILRRRGGGGDCGARRCGDESVLPCLWGVSL